MGTPIIGMLVWAARTPARWAAIPAPAIIICRPLAFAVWAYLLAAAGVRCAEETTTSLAIPIESRKSAAASITGKSESLPMTIPTNGLAETFLAVFLVCLAAFAPISLR